MIDKISIDRGEPDSAELAALLAVLGTVGRRPAELDPAEPRPTEPGHADHRRPARRRPWRYPNEVGVVFGGSWR